MKQAHLQSTLREWWRHIRSGNVILVMTIAAALLALVAPFDTAVHMRFVPRFVYWLGISAVTYSIGYIVAEWVTIRFANSSRVSRVMMILAIAGIAITAAILIVNFAIFGFWPRGDELVFFMGTTLVVAILVTLIFVQLGSEQVDSPSNNPPAILARLPPVKRGKLIALSAEDHYVRVETDRGSELVLIRLADAIAEVGNVEGLQVHRSHWVACSAISSSRRENGRVLLIMSNGSKIPVSHSYLNKLREMGLLT